MAMQPIPSFSLVPSTNATTQTPQVRSRPAVDASAETEAVGQQSPSSEVKNETAATASVGKQPSREQIDQAMKEVKQALPFQARDLQFSIDNETGRTVIKIVDPATKEVIRQMPSEELLAITRALDKFTGLLAKQKV